MLHEVQEAFLECGGAQCGICTPGMVLAAIESADARKDPTEDDVRVALAGNLCRCTGYMRIFESVLDACEAALRATDDSVARQLHAGGAGVSGRSAGRSVAAPGARPFAGGTDLMVVLEAGHLPQGRYVSLQHCPELLGIQEIDGGRISIGAMTTYTDIQRSYRLDADYPLLGTAARETGGVATQNRGTIGGNIANASPAADTPRSSSFTTRSWS